MPQVAINTGFFSPDGREERLSEYFCDRPGCLNVATEVIGCVRELGIPVAVCDEHASRHDVNICD